MSSYLFTGGPIYPICSQRIEQGALLTRGPTIAYVGPAEGLPPDAAGAEPIDLGGRPLLPGFCDGHVHLVLAAEQHASIDCRDVAKVTELQAFLRQRARELPAGEWIAGFGWEKKRLLAGLAPSPEILDVAALAHPVFLMSKDVHSAWLNTAGLQRLEAMDDLPPKCVIHRDQETGRCTGLVFEEILELRRRLIPPKSDEEKRALLGPFVRHLHANGITSVHCNEPPCDFRLVLDHFNHTRERERVRVLWSLVFESRDQLHRESALFEESLPGWIHPGGVKLFLDGAFGSLTAAVSEPYVGTRERGILNLDEQELDGWLQAIDDVGAYGVFHAIGDRAAAQALNALSRRSWPSTTRHRVEHAQLLSQEIVENHDLSGLVISAQPSHMWGDREIVARHVNPGLAACAYLYRTMQQKGALLIFGSDAPVEDVDPWPGIQAAVTRLADPDTPAWIEAQALTLHDAIAAHTTNPARLHGDCFGTSGLAPGRAADLVVLNTDPFALVERAPHRLRDTIRVELTLLDGELVHP